MEDILREEFPGQSNANDLAQALVERGWRQDRNSENPIDPKQIRRGLRNIAGGGKIEVDVASMTPTEYQNHIAIVLRSIFPSPVPVETEWRAITDIRGIYSPRIDIAVGPFSVVRGGNCIEEYDQMMDSSRNLIEEIFRCHHDNIKSFRPPDEQLNRALRLPNFDELMYANRNARCFLAIEIENRVTRKHLLGGAVNASALSRLGIAVGWTEEKVRALVKLQAYWDFLGSVGKNTFSTDNLVILSPAQLSAALGKV